MKYSLMMYGDPVLRMKCHDVPNLELADKLAKDLWDSLDTTKGIGLAAPQLGFNFNMFVLNVPERPMLKSDMSNDVEGLTKVALKRVYINPKIEAFSDVKIKYREGCLSIPGVYGDVERSYMIAVSYLDDLMEPQVDTLFDLNAIAFQHEYDHLNGVLFVDHISSLERKLAEKKLKKIMNKSR